MKTTIKDRVEKATGNPSPKLPAEKMAAMKAAAKETERARKAFNGGACGNPMPQAARMALALRAEAAAIVAVYDQAMMKALAVAALAEADNA
jgi:hypothetical protein